MDAAQWVFQISVLTCIVNLISIPYNSLIVAHEKLNAFAAISILQVILTCASAYCLSYFPTGRLLDVYKRQAITSAASFLFNFLASVSRPEAFRR